jgi:hypothetical protein
MLLAGKRMRPVAPGIGLAVHHTTIRQQPV